MKNKIFKLFSCCIAVKGFKRSVIYDLQRNSFETIPNTMYYFIIDNRDNTYNKVMTEYNKKFHKIIDEYYDWLIKNEYGFWCEKEFLANFTEINMQWHSPHQITNSIIDIDNLNLINYEEIFVQLKELAIPHIQIRAFSNIDIDFFVSMTSIFRGSRVESIEVITPFLENLDYGKFTKLLERELRINKITFYKTIQVLNGLSKIEFVTIDIKDSNSCGVISPDNFRVNLACFTEALHFNSCLNRKLSIDTKGEIRNCPSMVKSYGNVKNTKLSKALENENFKKIWSINKDNIKVCQDCEFRYMCLDCRAFVDETNDPYSRPLKCDYNPYIAKWKCDNGYIPINKISNPDFLILKNQYDKG